MTEQDSKQIVVKEYVTRTCPNCGRLATRLEDDVEHWECSYCKSPVNKGERLAWYHVK